jgi:hypothetical protein
MSRNARILTLTAAALALAISGFLLLRPKDDTGSSTGASTPTATTGVPAPHSIALKGGRPVGGMADIQVNKSDIVRLDITSDDAETIHVHGYDLETQVAPGRPAHLRFVAKIDGRFEIESHTTETQIGELTVNP